MLPEEYRLKHMKDFEILYQVGQFLGGAYVTMKCWRMDPEKFPRRKYAVTDLKIGFVVGTKVSKSAVKRNRAKRQMREVVRLLLQEGRIKEGYMIALMGKSGILGASYADIEQDILALLRRGGVMRLPTKV